MDIQSIKKKYADGYYHEYLSNLSRKAFYICFCWAFVIFFAMVGFIQGIIEGWEYFIDLMEED